MPHPALFFPPSPARARDRSRAPQHSPVRFRCWWGLAVAAAITVPAARAAAPAAPPPPLSGAALLEGDGPLLIGPGLPPLPAPAAAPSPAPPAPPTPSTPAAPPPAGASQPATVVPPGRELVLDRRRRLLKVVEEGRILHRFPVAVGMPGWETPVGRFRVFEKTAYPVWEHPAKGTRTPPGPDNPLGSRWIGFHRDCKGRRGWDGEQMLDLRGCLVAGFHGTPHRWTVGQAVSHGCVRLYDEHVRKLYELVSLGMPVTVLP